MYPYRSPEDPAYHDSYGNPQRQRSVWLTLWLVLSTIFSLLAVAQWIAATNNVRITSPLVCVLSLMIFANLICISAIWFWKRWGVIGVAVIAIASPVLETIAGTATPSDYIAPAIQLAILYFLVKDTWDFDFT